MEKDVDKTTKQFLPVDIHMPLMAIGQILWVQLSHSHFSGPPKTSYLKAFRSIYIV